MRLYSFCNVYLSSIQQGIQSAHILGELNNKLHAGDFAGTKGHLLLEWQDKHKTMVVCNGGNRASLMNYISLFLSKENPFPYASFYEDKDSLDGALTGVGIILPKEVYDVERTFDKFRKINIYKHVASGTVYTEPDTFMYQLVNAIKSAPLAR